MDVEIFNEIPPTWTCCRCDQEFNNGPFGPRPMGFDTRYDMRMRKRVFVGHICKDCWGKPSSAENEE